MGLYGPLEKDNNVQPQVPGRDDGHFPEVKWNKTQLKNKAKLVQDLQRLFPNNAEKPEAMGDIDAGSSFSNNVQIDRCPCLTKSRCSVGGPYLMSGNRRLTLKEMAKLMGSENKFGKRPLRAMNGARP